MGGPRGIVNTVQGIQGKQNNQLECTVFTLGKEETGRLFSAT